MNPAGGRGGRRRAAEPAGVSRAEVVAMSELLVRLFLALRAADRRRALRGMELSGHALRAVLHLVSHEERTIGELAEGLGVSVGWASRIADELERAGYVVRERDELDRRIVRLHLSPGTRTQAGQLYRARGRVVARALADLDAAERETVSRFLRRLTSELESYSSGASSASTPDAASDTAYPPASAASSPPSRSTNSVGSVG
jgi:DNA-binding MarR family transcriptional regulator